MSEDMDDYVDCMSICPMSKIIIDPETYMNLLRSYVSRDITMQRPPNSGSYYYDIIHRNRKLGFISLGEGGSLGLVIDNNSSLHRTCFQAFRSEMTITCYIKPLIHQAISNRKYVGLMLAVAYKKNIKNKQCYMAKLPKELLLFILDFADRL